MTVSKKCEEATSFYLEQIEALNLQASSICFPAGDFAWWYVTERSLSEDGFLDLYLGSCSFLIIMINNIILWASEHSQCAGSEDVRCFCEGSFFLLMYWQWYFMIELSLTIRTEKDKVMMTLVVEITMIPQIPQLSGGIVHYPGTFDSCLEVIVAKWISLDSSREKHQILILQHSWSGEVWKLYWSTLSAHILSPLKSLFWEWSWKVSHIIYFNWCQIGFGFSASIVIRKGQPNALVATKGPQIKPVVGFEILMSVCSTFVPNSDL